MIENSTINQRAKRFTVKLKAARCVLSLPHYNNISSFLIIPSGVVIHVDMFSGDVSLTIHGNTHPVDDMGKQKIIEYVEGFDLMLSRD